MGAGAEAMGSALIRCAATSPDPEILQAVHGLALAFGVEDTAIRIEAILADDRSDTSALALSLLADRLTARAEYDEALLVLDRAQGMGQNVAARLMDINNRCGRYGTTVAIASEFAPEALVSAAPFLFDAHWSQGNEDAAAAVITESIRTAGLTLASIQRAAAVARHRGEAPAAAADRLLSLARSRGVPLSVHDHYAVLFEFNLLDELLESHRTEVGDRWVGPGAAFFVARCWYLKRDFDEARRVSKTILGSSRDRDARKLIARIEFELGQFRTVADERAAVVLPFGGFDEVRFFAELHVGQIPSAIESYLQRDDANALTAVFGQAADLTARRAGAHRVVVAQDGPGDELITSCTYRFLNPEQGQVSVVCDPRLQSLMERSFPELVFVPSVRQPSRPALGLTGPGAEPRLIGPMHRSLTARAFERIRDADSVTLARSMWRLHVDSGPCPPHLVPDPVLVADWSRRIVGRTIGLVWRSEYVDAMRRIHFVRAEELAPLSKLNCRYVCLQHDASPAERSILSDLFGDRIDFFDDANLRDDFDVLAALVGSLDAVVGPGTATVELAASVGTPTIYLNPNVFGLWRQRACGDFWHESMQHAAASDPRRPAECVESAAALLARALSDRQDVIDVSGRNVPQGLDSSPPI